MPDLPDGNVVVTTLLIAGLVGGIVLIVSRRARLRRLTALAALACAVGYGGFGVVLFGGVSPEYLEAVQRRLVPTPLPAGGTAAWEEMQRALGDAEVGLLSDAEFIKLLGVSTPNRSIGSRGGSALTMIEGSLRADRLPARYVTLTVDWLIDSWPVWSVGAGPEVDGVPMAVLRSANISNEARDRFVDFMLALQGDPKHVLSHGWIEALDWLALGGRLDADRLATYVGNLATPKLELVSRDGAHWRGDLALLRLAAPAGGANHMRPGSRLQYRGNMRVRDEGILFKGGEQALPFFAFMGSDELGTVLVPDTPGKHRLIVDVSAEFTHDDLRSYFALNPGDRPAGLRIKDVPEVKAERQVVIDFVVEDQQAPAPEVLRDAELAARLSGCIREPAYLDSVSIQRDGTCRGRGEFTVIDPPVGLAMDVVWVIDGKEWVVGWFVAEEGKQTRVRYSGNVGSFQGGNCQRVLRPNLTLIKHPRGLKRVYDGPALTTDVRSYTR